MTVSSTSRVAGPYNGNDATTAFPFAFKVFSKQDIEITHEDADGVQTVLVLDSDYSVSLNADQDNNPGGSITYPLSGDPLPTGERLFCVSVVAYMQTAAITNLGNFQPRVHENAFDRFVILIQQLLEKVNRAIKLPVGDSASTTLPSAAARAGGAIVFDDDGNVGVSVDIGANLAAIEGNATAAAEAASATAADRVQTGLDRAAAANSEAQAAAIVLGNFLQSGTGATARTFTNKNRDYASFEDFGAVGDGATDDTTALSNAFASGKKIIAQRGKTYKITSTLTITEKDVDFSGATISYVGAKNVFAMVVNNTTGINGKCSVRNFALTCADTDTTNRTHGICLGGGCGVLDNVRIQGFTGISLALGSGAESYTGVTLPGAAQCYYWNVSNVAIASTAGWNVVIKTTNNANRFANISTFPYNGFNTAPPRVANCTDEMVNGGMDNVFERVSLEAAPSNRKALFLATANGNEFLGKLYLEYNTDWATPPFPRVEALAQSSSNRLRARHPYGASEPISDLGTGNDLRCDPTFYINGTQFNQPNSGVNMVKNGRFENGLTGWVDLSTGTTVSYVTGFLTGKALRLDVVAGRPQLSQDLVAIGGYPAASLAGMNITIAARIKTNLSDLQFRLANSSNAVVVSDGNYHWVSSTIKVPSGLSSVLLQIITSSSGVTGYLEVSDVTAVIGNEPLALATRDLLEGSATYNPPSLAAGAIGATATISVLGAALGDHVVSVSFSLDTQGVNMSNAWVSAADTVSMIPHNPTAGTIDLASGTIRVRVQKA